MKITISLSRPLGALLYLLTLLLVAGCGGSDDAQDEGWRRVRTATPEASAPATDSAPGGVVSLAGITFVPRPEWSDLGPSGMRKAQYQLAPVEGDTAPAEVNVFFFGADQGGTIEANLQRWIGQMSLPDGGDPAAVAERSTMPVGDMTAHVVSLNGTYNASMGGPMSGGTEARTGHRMVGVVLEAPGGSVFFKLTGPVATAKAMEEGLLATVREVKTTG